jgi:hypothetical protein
MSAPYTAAPPVWQSEMRSVTPATNNINRRYPSAPPVPSSSIPGGMGNGLGEGDNFRSMTPQRYYNRQDDTEAANANTDPRMPSSTGLIRLSLKKPMGIVFEPMYDPNQATVQRGVRICDLPRTGAAALSRKLQVGDELLQINDTTVSRMTFDEIMDFIIEADPDAVNLLFRRPRKETLQARQGVQQKLNAAANKDNPSTVKWVDDEQRAQQSSGKKPPKDRSAKRKESKKTSRRAKKETVTDDEETLQSSIGAEESFKGRNSRKKSKSRKDPYESESFLDVLIDTICSNSNSVCRDTFRPREEEEYFSDEEESFATQEDEDEDTYATYEESLDVPPRAKQVRKPVMAEEPSQDEDTTEDEAKEKRRKNMRKELEEKEKAEKKKYTDDGTLETLDSIDREKQPAMPPLKQYQPPLGLAAMPLPTPAPVAPRVVEEVEDEQVNPTAPIHELEYDHFDGNADVSVMESLGGPSLLIEKRAAQTAVAQSVKQSVPEEVMEKFGLDYPSNFGFTRKQTIEADPLRYYTFVVKELLEEHEPEKVRLLDKLLAKYQGREDHLVQKLSVRYNRLEEGTPSIPEVDDEAAFSEAVKKTKANMTADAAINTARERMQAVPEDENQGNEWPEKEHKEPDREDEEEESVSGSEYSRDSVDGTSPAVIAQVSELLNYVYGKTSVPGQIDRVSTIMRAYEGREAVLLELLETKALIKANKEKENADTLPSFLRNSQAAQKNAANNEVAGSNDLPPVTPMATQPPAAINDDISSMSGVSSPATGGDHTLTNNESEDVEVKRVSPKKQDPAPMSESPKKNSQGRSTSKPPATPDKGQKKKKGLFGGLFGKRKDKEGGTPARSGSRNRA